MNTACTISPEKIFGFFELDDSGIVRYSRPTRAAESDDDAVVGEDFFELATFQNRDDLRRRFKRFVESHDAANSFIFDCFFNNSVVRTKVMLTRAFQTEYFPPERIVMLDIRESS